MAAFFAPTPQGSSGAKAYGKPSIITYPSVKHQSSRIIALTSRHDQSRYEAKKAPGRKRKHQAWKQENQKWYSSSVSSSRNIPYKTTYISLDHGYSMAPITTTCIEGTSNLMYIEVQKLNKRVRSDVATCAQKRFQPVTFIQHHPHFDFQGHKFDIQGLAMDYASLQQRAASLHQPMQSQVLEDGVLDPENTVVLIFPSLMHYDEPTEDTTNVVKKSGKLPKLQPERPKTPLIVKMSRGNRRRWPSWNSLKKRLDLKRINIMGCYGSSKWLLDINIGEEEPLIVKGDESPITFQTIVQEPCNCIDQMTLDNDYMKILIMVEMLRWRIKVHMERLKEIERPKLKTQIKATSAEVHARKRRKIERKDLLIFRRTESSIIEISLIQDGVITELNARFFKLEAIIQVLARERNGGVLEKLDFNDDLSNLSADFCDELNHEFLELFESTICLSGSASLDMCSDEDVAKLIY
nr:phospholipase-like protein [Tanacetum cinerariifolium]